MAKVQNPFKRVDKPVFECEYEEFEKLIQDAFGINDYSLVAAEELSNDVVYDFELSPDDNDWDSEDLNSFQESLDGDWQYNTWVLTKKLFQMGILSVKQYYVNICW